jgi:hypothetical protein
MIEFARITQTRIPKREGYARRLIANPALIPMIAP